MSHTYKVSAGSSNDGTLINNAPYNGPIDSQSVADFAYKILYNSFYRSSETARALSDLEWAGLSNQFPLAEGNALYIVYDDENEEDDFFVCVELP